MLGLRWVTALLASTQPLVADAHAQNLGILIYCFYDKVVQHVNQSATNCAQTYKIAPVASQLTGLSKQHLKKIMFKMDSSLFPFLKIIMNAIQL